MPVSTTKILIRDITAQADTAIALTPGCTIYLSQLPAKPCINSYFDAKFAKAFFWLDGQLVADQQWSSLYCYPGKTTPLILTGVPASAGTDSRPLTVGPHTFTWAIDNQPRIDIPFTVAAAPPVAQSLAAFGANYQGADWPSIDIALHPEIVPAQNQLHQTWARLWIENDRLALLGDAYWTKCRAMKKAGIKIALVDQSFQYANPKFSMPPDIQRIGLATAIPPDAADAIIWGNEVDTAAYCSASIAQHTHSASLVCPITRAKKILNVSPSAIDDIRWCQSAATQGLYAEYDAIDFHVYEGSAAQVVSTIQQFQAFGTSIKKPIWISELGVRGNRTAQAWADETAQALIALKQIPGTFFPFSQFPIEALDQACPLTKTFAHNEPHWSAFLRALGN